jgi:hypothetical protein
MLGIGVTPRAGGATSAEESASARLIGLIDVSLHANPS